MKFVIDRIEEDIVVCQNLETKEMFEIKLKELPFDVKEGNILDYTNNLYVLDKEEEMVRKKRIDEKMKNLWK